MDFGRVESSWQTSIPSSVSNSLDEQLICYPQGRFLHKFLPHSHRTMSFKVVSINTCHILSASRSLRRYLEVFYLHTFGTYSFKFWTTLLERHMNKKFHIYDLHHLRINIVITKYRSVITLSMFSLPSYSIFNPRVSSLTRYYPLGTHNTSLGFYIFILNILT